MSNTKITTLMSLALLSGAAVAQAELTHPEKQTHYCLPEDFKVIPFGTGGVIRSPDGTHGVVLPTINDYMGEDGGYVAIYSHEKEGSIYSVGGDIYVIGQIRVQGHYEGRIFVPAGYHLGDDITRDPKIVALCESYFPAFQDKLWIGGDTGGWFGIELN